MTNKMKIFLYEVDRQESISDTIDHIKTLGMEKRIRPVSGYKMKLENIVTQNVEGDHIYFLDFCKHRVSGPGRAKNDRKIQGFNLGPDEAFGEMTAALYDPQTHFVVMQYNHYGPRAGGIAEYFSKFRSDDGKVTFNPRIRDDVSAEINKKKFNHSLTFGYSTAALTPKHKEALGVLATLNVLEGLGNNIGEVQITVKKRRGKFHRMEDQVPFLTRLLRVANTDDAVITSAKVSGAMTGDDAPEVLDLINARVFAEVEGLKQNKTTKMYSFNNRSKLLIEAFNAWKRSGIITPGELR